MYGEILYGFIGGLGGGITILGIYIITKIYLKNYINNDVYHIKKDFVDKNINDT
jgi:hypothetical protein